MTEDEYEKAQFDGLEGWAPTAEITYSFYSSKTDAEAGGAATVTPENAGTYWLRADYPGDTNYGPAFAILEIEISRPTSQSM